MSEALLNRRSWIARAGAAVGVLTLAACQRGQTLGESLRVSPEALTRRSQRLLIPREALAPEYRPQDISPFFKPNGSIDPAASDYVALRDGGFADYRLTVDGLVERPLSLSLDELRERPSRTQITKHLSLIHISEPTRPY